MTDTRDTKPAASADTRRIAQLEAELAFQADALRELNEALATQQLDLIAVRKQLSLLGGQLGSLRSQLAQQNTEDADERPPHY